MVDMGRTAKGLTALGILTAGVVVGAVAERLATRRLREGEFVGIEAAGGHSASEPLSRLPPHCMKCRKSGSLRFRD